MKRLTLALFFSLLYATSLAPLFLCDPLPLNDYPNHMARVHVIAEIDRSTDLQQHYEVDWEPLPNLALDLLAPPLARPISAERATWVFTALLLLLLASGTVALHWALFRQLTPYPLGAFLLLFNRELLWGFLNFCFGVGLALWAVAVWIYGRDRLSWWIRLPLLAGMALLVYFSHIHAYGCMVILIGGYELATAWAGHRANLRRAAMRLLAHALALAVPMPLFLFGTRTTALASEISYGPLLNKLARLLSPFNNYNPTLDVATWLVCVALLVLGLARKRVRIHRRMRLPLLLLLLAFVMLPQQLFDAWGVDRRVIMVLSFALVASTNGNPTLSGRKASAVAVVLLLLFIGRTAVLALNWHRANGIYTKQIALLDRVERGSRLAVVIVDYDRPHLQNPPLWELASVAVTRRHVQVNSMFAERGHHILRVRFAPDGFARSPSQKFVIDGWADSNRQLAFDIYRQLPLHQFDYLYLVNEQLVRAARPAWLQLIASAPPGALYRIAR